MADALQEAELDREALLARIDAKLDGEPEVDDLLRPAFAELEALPLLFGALFLTKAIDGLLVESGSSVPGFTRALVRTTGEEVEDGTLPEDVDEDVDIVFHDDDFTTMDRVVQILTECFAIPQLAAVAMMVRVHKTGSSVVKTCPASEARRRIEKGRAQALVAGMPLRISWRPHTPPSEPDYEDA